MRTLNSLQDIFLKCRTTSDAVSSPSSLLPCPSSLSLSYHVISHVIPWLAEMISALRKAFSLCEALLEKTYFMGFALSFASLTATYFEGYRNMTESSARAARALAFFLKEVENLNLNPPTRDSSSSHTPSFSSTASGISSSFSSSIGTSFRCVECVAHPRWEWATSELASVSTFKSRNLVVTECALADWNGLIADPRQWDNFLQSGVIFEERPRNQNSVLSAEVFKEAESIQCRASHGQHARPTLASLTHNFTPISLSHSSLTLSQSSSPSLPHMTIAHKKISTHFSSSLPTPDRNGPIMLESQKRKRKDEEGGGARVSGQKRVEVERGKGMKNDQVGNREKKGDRKRAKRKKKAAQTREGEDGNGAESRGEMSQNLIFSLLSE